MSPRGRTSHGNHQVQGNTRHPYMSPSNGPSMQSSIYGPNAGMAMESSGGLLGMAASAAEDIETRHNVDPMHNCTCGPACGCVACPVHPYNVATRNHLLSSAAQLMQNSPGSDEHYSHLTTTDQPSITQSNAFPGSRAFTGLNMEPEPTFNTRDYHMFVGSFSREEMGAAHPQALQAWDQEIYDKTYHDREAITDY